MSDKIPMTEAHQPVIIIGAGLAGCEAAWQLLRRHLPVTLYEMRPKVMTPAHTSGDFAELICSNSMGSVLPDRAPGLLKAELHCLGSLILSCAEETAVPAGRALAVDRQGFSRLVQKRLCAQPQFTLIREEVESIPNGVAIVAAGPLASSTLSESIAKLAGQSGLAFYDAMAPIISLESIDMNIAFRASRYGEDGDYINCPMTEEQYDNFVSALAAAETIPLRQFEQEDKRFFEACLPVEVMAKRGRMVLAYGPLRPVGIRDPKTGRRPFAVVQLRQDNAAGTLYNIVGFQTNLRYTEQERVFRLIPGLEQAEFIRLGQMHRNTFLDSPRLLKPTFQWHERDNLFFAGQITGTEGYLASAASGLIAGLNAARLQQGQAPVAFPKETMIGALSHYISNPSITGFQPMKPNFGLISPPDERLSGRARSKAISQRALAILDQFIAYEDLLPKAATATSISTME